jgi:hypothetical protein
MSHGMRGAKTKGRFFTKALRGKGTFLQSFSSLGLFCRVFGRFSAWGFQKLHASAFCLFSQRPFWLKLLHGFAAGNVKAPVTSPVPATKLCGIHLLKSHKEKRMGTYSCGVVLLLVGILEVICIWFAYCKSIRKMAGNTPGAAGHTGETYV